MVLNVMCYFFSETRCISNIQNKLLFRISEIIILDIRNKAFILRLYEFIYTLIYVFCFYATANRVVGVYVTYPGSSDGTFWVCIAITMTDVKHILNLISGNIQKVIRLSGPGFWIWIWIIIANLISVQSTGKTRSSSLVTLARPSVASSLQITNRSFTYASPYLWNQLSSSFRQPHSVHCPPGSPHPAHITSCPHVFTFALITYHCLYLSLQT